ncbi:MAG: nucleoside/nucleotide kinase family protein [Propionibacteriaceae bacterium]|jgi:pantothenate kinase|nr:nucleoside/nucleotide kinase family protein [Propionibacteriaceae bacterium]
MIMADMSDLLGRAARLAAGGRAILGVTGAPGAGKSTFAEHLVSGLLERGVAAVRLPMDGFHLADATLASLGLLQRKGSVETFDGYGYCALLHRLLNEADPFVYAPDFDRSLGQPLAGAVTIGPDVQLVVTEGNYLLNPENPWAQARAALAEVWYCRLPDAERQRRLVTRHMRFGKSEEGARSWVSQVDEANAAQVSALESSADLVIDMEALGLPPGRD